MTQPVIGGKSKVTTGLEGFDIPYDWGSPSSGSSGSGSSGSTPYQTGFDDVSSYAAQDQGSAGGGVGGMDMQSMIAKQQIMLQMSKAKEDFGRLVKQAKFFLPRTLEGIASQYGTQGSYWSSGRRGAQQEARAKTRFDLKDAKANAEYEIQQAQLQLAAQNASEMQSRNA